MPDFDHHAPLDAAARAALRDLRGEHKRYQQEQPKMTLADHGRGHHWTLADFKRENSQTPSTWTGWG